jgi:muconolactone delta-isomerase
MKFLTISKMKETASTVPPSMMRPLMEATLDLMNQEMKAGGISEAYFMAGCSRSMVIFEANSAEEIVQRISALPIGGLMDFETCPLADFNESMKVHIENLKTAEKIFPGPPK